MKVYITSEITIGSNQKSLSIHTSRPYGSEEEAILLRGPDITDHLSQAREVEVALARVEATREALVKEIDSIVTEAGLISIAGELDSAITILRKHLSWMAGR